MDEMSEQRLIMQLYDSYAPMILALARAKLPVQDAEDVLHASLERLLPHLPRIAALEEPQRKAYVYAAARSEVADRLRRRARWQAVLLETDALPENSLPDRCTSVEQQIIDREAVHSLRRAIRMLPEKQRTMLEMHYVQEMTAVQISQRLQMRPDAVRQQLMRLRRKLKSMMEEE